MRRLGYWRDAILRPARLVSSVFSTADDRQSSEGLHGSIFASTKAQSQFIPPNFHRNKGTVQRRRLAIMGLQFLQAVLHWGLSRSLLRITSVSHNRESMRTPEFTLRRSFERRS